MVMRSFLFILGRNTNEKLSLLIRPERDYAGSIASGEE